MSILIKLRKIAKRIQKKEYRYLFKRIFPRGNPVFYESVQLIFKLSDTEKFDKLYARLKEQDDYDVVLLNQSNLEFLCSTFPDEESKFRRRINKGYRCYMVVKNSEIAAYLWALEAKKDYFDTNSLWRFRPGKIDGVWYFDGYVKPQYRRRGLFPFLMGKVREEYLAKGYVTQYGETDARNEMSLNTHLRVGYSVLWKVILISVFGLKIYFARNSQTGERRIDFRYALSINNLVL